MNGLRRARIAKGSGVTVSEVNQLLERFGEAQKMMKQMAKGGGIPGMPGMPGSGRKGRQPKQVKKKGKSGNPAKRAAEEKALAEKAAGRGSSPAGSSFGAGPGLAGCRISTRTSCPRASRNSSVSELGPSLTTRSG